MTDFTNINNSKGYQTNCFSLAIFAGFQGEKNVQILGPL